MWRPTRISRFFVTPSPSIPRNSQKFRFYESFSSRSNTHFLKTLQVSQSMKILKNYYFQWDLLIKVAYHPYHLLSPLITARFSMNSKWLSSPLCVSITSSITCLSFLQLLHLSPHIDILISLSVTQSCQTGFVSSGQKVNIICQPLGCWYSDEKKKKKKLWSQAFSFFCLIDSIRLEVQ